ncbi:MAG: alpha/beta hydrolase, partial [bacterium]|nr:alpha/beta hydrolase [bacterium]
VPVELHQFPGTFHGSSVVAAAEVSKRSTEEMMGALRRGLRRNA